MVKIWRVENIDGDGCYTSHLPELEDFYINHKEDYFTRPLTTEDIGIKRNINENEICGFISKKQAKKWFTQEDLKILLPFGFELKQVEVKTITALGECQILAIRGYNDYKI